MIRFKRHTPSPYSGIFQPNGTRFNCYMLNSPIYRKQTKELIDKLTTAFGTPVTYYTGKTLQDNPVDVTENTWYVRRAHFSTTVSLTSDAQMQFIALTATAIIKQDFT